MILFTNYYLILIAMGIFGLGDGLANLSVIDNCWKYFPDYKGLINGIIIGGLGLSSAILTPIADYLIINPDGIEPVDGIYEEDIANNLLNFLYFISVLFLVLGFFAVVFTFEYKSDPKSAETIFSGNLESQQKVEGSLKVLCDGFCSLTNLTLSLFCFCGPCKSIYFNFNF
jgi:hypothetical protein